MGLAKQFQQLIKQLCCFDMPIRTVGEYLKRWGFNSSKNHCVGLTSRILKPLINGWIKSILQLQNKQKKKEQKSTGETKRDFVMTATMVEATRHEDKHRAIRLHPRCKRVNLISTVTNQGKVRFMVYEDKMNSSTLIKFMKRLIKDSTRKIFLVLDNLKVHHSHIVRNWREKHKEQIEVFSFYHLTPRS